ncbi:MAG TPA: hypothetical protein VFV99_33680 [Kofleriaceae bacterium]|nr:hypothetical protein [Kofleriaceae bacterium]
MRWLVVLLLVILAMTRGARADNPSVAAARKAVDEIRYDDAQALLVQALKQGANRPDVLVEIYRLSAATAAVLGPTDLAEQYYRRMIALDPDSTLPPDASPRLREPFVAAQAYMAAQQRFEARATRTAQGIEVSVVDPLGMVVAIATLDGGELRAKQPYAGQAITLQDVGDRVVLLDESGNFLREIPLPARQEVDEPVGTSTPSTPFFRRWYVYAVPTVAFAGATAFLFVDAQRAKDRLDDIIANNGGHFYDDAETERRRYRNETIAAWVGAGITVGFATTAIIMAATRPRAVTVTPSVGADHASVQLEAKF